MAKQIELRTHNGMLHAGQSLMIYRYPEGDVDTLKRSSPMNKIIGALYDMHQISDDWEDGTEFILSGKVVARVSGVHMEGV